MPSSKSAKKRVRQNEVARDRNRRVRSSVRTAQKQLLALVETGDAAAAALALKQISKMLDAAVQKGIIHANTAARTKSRLSRRVAAIQPAAE